jgi:hypothetical protein
MKKFAITLIAGLTLLAAASVAQAHQRYYGGVRAAVSIAVPVGHHGFAVLGTAPYYYPVRYHYRAPYVGRAYARGYVSGYRHARKHHWKRDHWKPAKHRDKHDRDHYRHR